MISLNLKSCLQILQQRQLTYEIKEEMLAQVLAFSLLRMQRKKKPLKKNKNNSKMSYNVLKKQPNSLGFFYYSKWTNTISRKLYTLLKLFWHSQSIKNVQALILWLYVAIIIYYNDENLTVQNQELQIQHHEIIQYNLHFWRIQVYFELLS